MEASAYNEVFTMPAAGVGDAPHAGLLAMLEEMMETAGRHAGILGVGVRDLHAKGLTWVLARLHARISTVPPPQESVHVATWPCGRHRLFAVREFRLGDEAGNEILRATSAWALMNMDTRRPARLDPHLPVFTRHPGRMVEDNFPPLPPVEQAGSRFSFRAVASDIDINDHVNNTVYLDWALRAVADGMRSQRPVSLEAAFLGEARLGDEIVCQSECMAGNGRVIALQNLQDAASGRELNRMRWVFENPVA